MTTILAVILVVSGIADMLMIGFPPVHFVLGIIILAVFPYLGRLALNTFEKRKRASMANEA